ALARDRHLRTEAVGEDAAGPVADRAGVPLERYPIECDGGRGATLYVHVDGHVSGVAASTADAAAALDHDVSDGALRIVEGREAAPSLGRIGSRDGGAGGLEGAVHEDSRKVVEAEREIGLVPHPLLTRQVTGARVGIEGVRGRRAGGRHG